MTSTSGTNRREYDHLFKLLIIGDSAVGKSSLLLRFADHNFSHNYVTTVGVDFKVKSMMVDNEKIKLQIWDTAGQERFRTITSTYYRGTHGVMIVFDLTNEDSYLNVKRWLHEIDQHCDIVQRVLVGNKCDDKANRVVQLDDALDFAHRMGVRYFETSAKENINVEEMFGCISHLVLDQKRRFLQAANEDNVKKAKKINNQEKSIKLKKQKKRHKSKNGCC